MEDSSEEFAVKQGLISGICLIVSGGQRIVQSEVHGGLRVVFMEMKVEEAISGAEKR